MTLEKWIIHPGDTRVIDIEAVPVHQVVSMDLRQALCECFESLSTVPRTINDDATIRRIALLIFHCRNEPGRVRIFRVSGNRKSEYGWLHILDLSP